MRAPYRSSSNFSASFGPGPLTPAIKALMVANVAAFLVSMIVPAITLSFGLRPADVIGSLQIWQPVTYMFLHGGVFHLLFNMLALWMFGVELERTWGSRFFMRFYFIVGIGAALTTLLLSLMPLPFASWPTGCIFPADRSISISSFRFRRNIS
jgi:membrane associated rhomboid family serine protease